MKNKEAFISYVAEYNVTPCRIEFEHMKEFKEIGRLIQMRELMQERIESIVRCWEEEGQEVVMKSGFQDLYNELDEYIKSAQDEHLT